MMLVSMMHISMIIDLDACVYDVICMLHISIILYPDACMYDVCVYVP